MAKKSKGKKKTTIKSRLERAEAHISNVDEDVEHLKMLVYGKNGKGKTFFGATGPKCIIIDCNEQGTPSIRKIKGVKKFKVDDWTDIDLAYWYLRSGKHDRQTVVIDTTTALSQLCMKFILGEEVDRDPTRDPKMASKREYGKLGMMLTDEFLRWRSLDMNVIFLAQESKSFVDEDSDEEPEVGPSILGTKGLETLTACVNVIARVYVKGVVVKTKKKVKGKTKVVSKEVAAHRMLLGEHDLYVTKVNVQDHGLPRIMKDPTIPKILKRINKGED